MAAELAAQNLVALVRKRAQNWNVLGFWVSTKIRNLAQNRLHVFIDSTRLRRLHTATAWLAVATAATLGALVGSANIRGGRDRPGGGDQRTPKRTKG